MSDAFDREMRAALISDGEKLRALTGEDHGPYFITGERAVLCEECMGDGGGEVPPRDAHSSPAWVVCRACAGRGETIVDFRPIDMADLDEANL